MSKEEVVIVEPSREERVAEMAAEMALKKFAAEHACRFSDRTAKKIHILTDEDRGIKVEQIETLVAVAKADIETVGTMLRAAKIANGAINSVAKSIVIACFFAVLLSLAFLAKRFNWKPF